MADEFKACSVQGCNGNAHPSERGVKGYCFSHYRRFKRHGDALGGGTSRGEPLRFFEDQVVNWSADHCLIWPYARNGMGYGHVRVDGKMRLVSRLVSFRVHGKPESDNLFALHSCGNGHLGCVNPRHLRWGTHEENMEDAKRHRRST